MALGLVAVATGLFGCSRHSTFLNPQTVVITAQNLRNVQTAVRHDSAISKIDQQRFRTFINAHAKSTNMYLGRNATEIIALQKAYETGLRLAASDRRKVATRRALMAHTFTLAPVSISDDAAHVIFTFSAHNFTHETVAHVTLGLSIFDAATQKRIGLTEWTIDRNFAPGSRLRFTQPLPYLHFAEDAGTMRLGAGKPRRVIVDVEAVTFADGGKAGEDD